MKAHNFLIYTGYVEGASWGCLALSHNNGFGSVEEALQHLGKCMLLGFREDEVSYQHKCCKKSKERGAKYCDQCGSFVQIPTIDVEELGELIINMQRGDMNDGAPQEVWEILDGNGWRLFGSTNASNDMTNITILQKHGECIIAQSAFGRMFNDSPEYIKYTNKAFNKHPKEMVKNRLSAPAKMKLFMDD